MVKILFYILCFCAGYGAIQLLYDIIDNIYKLKRRIMARRWLKKNRERIRKDYENNKY
jgi:hypothetical protein